MTPEERMDAYRRALRPAGGTVTDAELRALGAWAQPRRDWTAWAARVRELLAESPGRDLASAAIEARRAVEDGARSNETGAGRRDRVEPVGRGGRGRERASEGHSGPAKGLASIDRVAGTVWHTAAHGVAQRGYAAHGVAQRG